MSLDSVCESLLLEFRSRPTIRAGSLITTVFGDAIAPRGGSIWLGSLIKLMADFGISERLVRTSVYRLANDGWFVSGQRGRKSFYRLTASGGEQFRAATHRIYAAPTDAWDGTWCLLLLGGLVTEARDAVRRQCGWLGFGAISTNVLAHPEPNSEDLMTTLRRLGVAADVVVMHGRTQDSGAAMRKLMHESWNLSAIGDRYAEFVERFRPAQEACKKTRSIAPRTAFLLRTLLIQEYRKVILRDPQLPNRMLPNDWPGTAAYGLCRDLYRSIYRQADEHVSETVETIRGRLAPAGGDYWQRFGGLPQADNQPG